MISVINLDTRGIIGSRESDVERLKHEKRALRERIGRFRAADHLPRADTHGRRQ